MSYPHRNFGRRKTDRFKVAVGMGLGLLLFGLVLQLSQCGGSTEVAGPTPTSSQPAVASTPAPAPTPTPTLVGEDPAAFELSCLPSSTLQVKYNGPAWIAKIDTYYTSFDDQTTAFAKQPHTVNAGDTVTRTFGEVCIQGDADQPGVKEIGGCFFDINGKPFNPRNEPAKTTECRNRCVPEWREAEPEYGDWEDYVEDDSIASTTVEQKCYKTQRRHKVIREVQTCSNERRIKIDIYETRQVEIPCPCVEEGQPGVKDYLTPTWSGVIEQGACVYGPPQLTPTFSSVTQPVCHENGTQAWIEEYTCKDDLRGTINVCRSATCPSCANTPASSSAAQGFSLANSGSSTETAWVNGNVVLGPFEFFDKDENGEEFNDSNGCENSDHAAKVVLVKAGTKYRYYLNVSDGQQLCSFDGKDISHISYFKCD